MDGLILIELALVCTSALLALTLALAWRVADRPRHALTWSAAFACGAVQWGISGFGTILFGPWGGLGAMAGALVCVMVTLITVGARQRVGLPDRFGRFALACAVAILVVMLAAYLSPGDRLRLVLTNLYPALVLPFAVAATARRRRPLNSPETFLIVGLVLFATFALTLAVVALGFDRPDQEAARAIYRLLLGVGLPPVCLALGLSLCFVLGGDLARRLNALVTCDPLTGALNRRGLDQAAAPVLASARRHGRKLTMVIADLDQFKAINDTNGHAAGDEALRRFALAVHALIREDDLFARLGGDEFCLLLSEATPGSAALVTERIRSSLGENLTASFGVATRREGEPLDSLLARADAALYQAKQDGRDRVILAAE
ncbi:MAG: GGDEF domain-containing protein [Sphingomonadales bacterium]|nr:MAG: GGDEF domain-containing protein [Sphingomonadales bacterium]